MQRLLLAFALVVTVGCAELYDPNYNSGPSRGYNDPYYDNRRYDDDYYRKKESERTRKERRKLENEREELEEERRELERQREKEQRERDQYRPPPPPPPPPERCPSGFSPSERKCSKEERRNGCQDMRLPGGLGCVKR